VKIKRIDKIDYSGDVYNLRIKSETGNNHNYIANGILVATQRRCAA
jgi:intein/homing endonuclease